MDYDESRLEWLLTRCQSVHNLSQFELSLIDGVITSRLRYGSAADVSPTAIRQLEKIARRAR